MSNIVNHYWGIDVSKNWLDIAIDEKVYRIEQTEDAMNGFISTHKKEKVLAVLESTGGYEWPIAQALDKAGVRVHIAHPNKIKAFAKAKGKLAKTDKLDARLLKDYGYFLNPKEIRALPSDSQHELQQLGARLTQLKEMHHQESCRLGLCREKMIQESLAEIIASIKKQIEIIEKAIMVLIKADELLKERFEILRSMKGVGPILAMTLITDLPELGKANKKEIAALVGIAPITKESGQKKGKAMIKYGRQAVRKILFMGALTASRYNLKLKIFFERLVAAGKPKKVAIVAVMRKMIVILNAMIASKSYYLG